MASPAKPIRNKPDLAASEVDRIFDGLAKLSEILDSLKVKWYLGHGACLGAVREGSLLPYDKDIDIIMTTDTNNERVLEAIKASGYFDSIYQRNDGHYRVITKKPHRLSESITHCIYFYHREGELYEAEVKPALSEESKFYLPARFFEKQDTIRLRGYEFPTFSPVKDYLEWLYGDWRTPDRRKGFRNFSTKHLRIRAEAMKKLSEPVPVPGQIVPFVGTKDRLHFRTVADLDRLVSDNLHRIPREIDAIVGIPRSGMLLASMICQYVNRPLLTLGELLSGSDPTTGRFRPPEKTSFGRVLVVDDAIGRGKTFKAAKEALGAAKIKAVYLTAYASEKTKASADITLEIIPLPRAWSWNVFHHPHRKQMWDMDGVICEDAPKVKSHLEARYLAHITGAKVLVSPTFPVVVCTGRREIFRRETLAWLEANNIKHEGLIMRPAGLEGWQAIAEYKAAAFVKSGREIFIESSNRQSEVIAQKSGKPVYCIHGQYYGK